MGRCAVSPLWGVVLGFWRRPLPYRYLAPLEGAAGIVVHRWVSTGCLCFVSAVISELFLPIYLFHQCKCVWRTHYVPGAMIEVRGKHRQQPGAMPSWSLQSGRETDMGSIFIQIRVKIPLWSELQRKTTVQGKSKGDLAFLEGVRASALDWKLERRSEKWVVNSIIHLGMLVTLCWWPWTNYFTFLGLYCLHL